MQPGAQRNKHNPLPIVGLPPGTGLTGAPPVFGRWSVTVDAVGFGGFFGVFFGASLPGQKGKKEKGKTKLQHHH